MATTVWLLIALASSALSAPSGVPVMELSAQESFSDDPYSDGITIMAEPYQIPSFAQQEAETPNFRWGLQQQSLTSKYPNNWYPPTNTAGNGILQDHFGNKVYFSNLFQNLPSFPPTINVPDTINHAGGYFSTAINRFQQFLSQAQQNAAQLTASAQNIKGDEYYQYGMPSHPGLLSQLLHLRPGGSYFRTGIRPEAEPYAQRPAYQVIAVMSMHDSPPIRVNDYLRQRSMNFEKTEQHIPQLESVVESALVREASTEMKKDMKEVAEVDSKDFAKDVAKEVASAVAEAAKKPGKVTEIVVSVDATEVDDDDDSSSSSSSSEEDNGKETHGATKKPEKKKGDHKSAEEDDDSDSSASSDSSESTETSTTASSKKVSSEKKEGEKKPSVRVDGKEEDGSSEEDERDSVEKVAMLWKGSRPVKAELERPSSKETAAHAKTSTIKKTN